MYPAKYVSNAKPYNPFLHCSHLKKSDENSKIYFSHFQFFFFHCKHFFITFFQHSPPIPYKSIALSLPFYAILFAHMGQNYGYETLMTELPTYMKQVLRFSLKAVSITKN